MNEMENEIITYNKLSFMLYSFFKSIEIQGFMSTDHEQYYYLPDGSKFKTVQDVENWFIETAEKIKEYRKH